MPGRFRQIMYLGWWFVRARFFGRRKPLQSVVFISDRCNLSCKHCTVYNHTNPLSKSWEQVEEDLRYCYKQGSRFVDFEGGEPTLWKGVHNGREVDVNDLCELARSMGFYSCTITTNAQKPFAGCKADSIWVSMDGIGSWHDAVRGEGTFSRLEKNIKECGHEHLAVSMSVNTLNVDSVPVVLEYVKANPAISKIAFNFHTPFTPETEYLTLPQDVREKTIDTIIKYKKKGYPIMNSKAGLRRMKRLEFTPQCWISNYIYTDGTRKPQCAGLEAGVCDKCGFSMGGEMAAVFSFVPETIFAGLDLRV